ncbi:hypothetical protein EOL73_01310 [Candidatus Saccharibacteria bacterium]|nr:hypothetical protein [Candidatus Saccharibacteria bacterium]NCU40376.1 hypothetical protein [Candidatus Saccharibacteria bacterium]
MNIKNTFSQAIKNRSFFLSSIALGLVLFAVFVVAAIEIRPNELQVPIRYSAFGITNIYRAQWYYEFEFVIFAIVAALSVYIIALKLFITKTPKFATYFLWFSTVLLTIVLVVTIAIFRVISVVE